MTNTFIRTTERADGVQHMIVLLDDSEVERIAAAVVDRLLALGIVSMPKEAAVNSQSANDSPGA